MRKYLRNIIRRSAEKQGMKPSKAVHDSWIVYQINKQGSERAVAENKLRGTHKKYLWESRIGRIPATAESI